MTSATALITPIRAIDDFGLSAPGPVTTRLTAYVSFARAPDWRPHAFISTGSWLTGLYRTAAGAAPRRDPGVYCTS